MAFKLFRNSPGDESRRDNAKSGEDPVATPKGSSDLGSDQISDHKDDEADRPENDGRHQFELWSLEPMNVASN